MNSVSLKKQKALIKRAERGHYEQEEA